MNGLPWDIQVALDLRISHGAEKVEEYWDTNMHAKKRTAAIRWIMFNRPDLLNFSGAPVKRFMALIEALFEEYKEERHVKEGA